MASRDHKIVRRAEAMGELSRLSGLLAERLNIEAPDTQATNRDSELAEIQRIENINKLLARLLEVSKAESESEPESEPVKKPAKKHGTSR